MGWARKEAILVAYNEDLDEALALVRSLGAEVIEVVRLSRWFAPDKSTYLRPGTIKKLRALASGKDPEYFTLYVYDSLKPRHKINLMKELKVNVKDKVELILEIFAIHAGSKEAKLQIEMARLLHSLPLIKEWINKSKLRELPGFMGPGKYAVDTYYTHVRKRIAKIRKELVLLRDRRARERERRLKWGIPHVAIGGYANAGKTTLFNLLTAESKPTGPEMFTTLSPKIGVRVIDGRKVAFIDTVGFIKDLPHEVIEAFHATLEQITSSDLLLLVVDSTEPPSLIKEKVYSSLDTLSRIGYVGKGLVAVINKVDRLRDKGISAALAVNDVLEKNYLWGWSVVRISAKEGYGLDWLLEEIKTQLNKTQEIPKYSSIGQAE